MSQRSRSLAERHKAKVDAENIAKTEANEVARIRDEKIAQDRKVVERETPGIWQNLQTEAAKQCNEYNEEPSAPTRLTVNLHFHNEIRITDASGRNLHFILDPRRHTILMRGFDGKLPVTLEIKVLPGDSGPSVVDERDNRCQIEDTVGVQLEQFLGLK